MAWISSRLRVGSLYTKIVSTRFTIAVVNVVSIASASLSCPSTVCASPIACDGGVSSRPITRWHECLTWLRPFIEVYPCYLAASEERLIMWMFPWVDPP